MLVCAIAVMRCRVCVLRIATDAFPVGIAVVLPEALPADAAIPGVIVCFVYVFGDVVLALRVPLRKGVGKACGE